MENEMEQNGVTEEELIPSVNEAEEILPAAEQAENIADQAEPAVIEEEPQKPKKKGTFKIVLISVVATLLVLALALGLTGGVLAGAGLIDFDDWFAGSDDGSYAVSEKGAPKMAKKVVGKIGKEKLTNGELQVYYKLNLLNLQQSQYAYYLYYYYGIDLTQPLDTLVYDETTGQTWQDLILENAVNSWHEITAMGMQGREEGFQLSAEQQEYLASIDSKIQEMATASGFTTVEDMIYADIGISATADGLRNFMENEYYYSCYYFNR